MCRSPGHLLRASLSGLKLGRTVKESSNLILTFAGLVNGRCNSGSGVKGKGFFARSLVNDKCDVEFAC